MIHKIKEKAGSSGGYVMMLPEFRSEDKALSCYCIYAAQLAFTDENLLHIYNETYIHIGFSFRYRGEFFEHI